MMRQVGYEDLNDLCRGIKKSFVHLETRDSYGTEVELPHMAKWRRGEEDDYAWLGAARQRGFYVFDDELVLFLHYAGNGTNTGFETTDDPATVRACREAFDAVWGLSVPHSDYRPE